WGSLRSPPAYEVTGCSPPVHRLFRRLVVSAANPSDSPVRPLRSPMLARLDQPIAAIATAPGRGAVGIVRVSAKDVRPIVDAVCGRALKPREATYLPFRAGDGSAIDQGLAIHFPAPHSYTGEDVL